MNRIYTKYLTFKILLMENTLENKRKFFSQYWGQKIVHWNRNLNISLKLNVLINEIDEYDTLILKPLSSITDEDYKYIVQNERMNPTHPLDDFELDGRISGIKESDIICADYLRSKGYALPWMGLSVEKLIEYGWIKLNNNL